MTGYLRAPRLAPGPGGSVMKNRVSGLLLAAVLALAVLAMPATSAPAQPTILTCAFGVTIQFNPGLTLTAANQTITGNAVAGTSLSALTPCSSPTGVPYQGATG